MPNSGSGKTPSVSLSTRAISMLPRRASARPKPLSPSRKPISPRTRSPRPCPGLVYDLPAACRTYLHPDDLIGSIGKIDPVRVRVYVDEPELGRVAIGQSVRITWDANPVREWTGTVEKRPTQIIALGARQVGEVLCTIQNQDHDLMPGHQRKRLHSDAGGGQRTHHSENRRPARTRYRCLHPAKRITR